MDIELRLEKPADYHETECVVREAFWNVYAPGCTEHYLVHVMRHSPNFVQDLDFVAVTDGKVIGCVMFVKGTILGDDSVTREVLTLGPLAVLPEYQKMGVGRKLVEHAITRASRLGFKAIVLCGDPIYYSRLGFAAAEKFGIRTADNCYFAALHALPLGDTKLEAFAGCYEEDRIYSVDEKAAADFDLRFPSKQRLDNTPTQERLLKILQMQRSFDAPKPSKP